MAVHVGVGSSGRDHDLAVATQRLQLAQEVIALQRGTSGPFLDASNVHNALSAWEKASGTKSPEQYWTDPKTVPSQFQTFSTFRAASGILQGPG